MKVETLTMSKEDLEKNLNTGMMVTIDQLLQEERITSETAEMYKENYGILLKKRSWWLKKATNKDEDYIFYVVNKMIMKEGEHGYSTAIETNTEDVKDV